MLDPWSAVSPRVQFTQYTILILLAVYRRTVLIIWPPFAHFDIIHGGRGLKYACEKVCASTGTRPTQEEHELVDIILSRYSGQRVDAVSTICRAALRWGDAALCPEQSGRVMLPSQSSRMTTYEVIKVFGFAQVQSS